jgi:hypothetical protein
LYAHGKWKAAEHLFDLRFEQKIVAPGFLQ